MRLIDADALLKTLNKEKIQFRANVNYFIMHAPTVDAEPVVRCKDCKHKPTGSRVNHDITFPEEDYRCPCRCEDDWYSWMPDDGWFCANGERIEDETN